MERIAYIAPSERWIPAIEHILEQDVRSGLVVVQTIDFEHILSEYRRLSREGYGVIIARGGTFLELLNVADSVTVMEIRVRTSDILMAIRTNRETYAGKIYVVLHNKIAVDFEKTVSLYNFQLEVMRYTSIEEMRQCFERIPESNVLVLTSGVAAQVTTRRDLRYEQLLIQKEAILETVERAKNYLLQSQADIQRVNLMESILSNVDEGILIFDSAHIVQEMNDRAQQLLQLKMDDLVGQNVAKAFPDLPARRKITSCAEQPRTFLHQAGSMMLNVTVAPFRFYKEEERFIMTLQDVTRIQEVERNIRRNLAKKGLTANYHFHDILTVEASMKQAIARAKSIASLPGNVLIYGENGTGKELFAQSIHNEGDRKNGPFVAVNCAALTESLLESELFGYVGGAFTGARREGKAGLFELAHEGTIFLDEINSMPVSLQAKILRVIEQQEVMRVGSDYVIPINVRVIAASNQPLRESIQAGMFRKDLYFRLNTFRINIPSVNERKKDILYLFRHYLAGMEHMDPDEIDLDPAFEKLLLEHDWWGNVREIRSTALRYHAFGGDNSGGDILVNEAAEADLVDDAFRISLPELNKTVERLVIESMLAKNMKKSDIADALGISRQALYKKLSSGRDADLK